MVLATMAVQALLRLWPRARHLLEREKRSSWAQRGQGMTMRPGPSWQDFWAMVARALVWGAYESDPLVGGAVSTRCCAHALTGAR